MAHTTTKTKMATKPPPTFLTLPRELRQQILRLAFDDALYNDHALTAFLHRPEIWALGTRRVEAMGWKMRSIMVLRGAWSTSTVAPRTYELAGALLAVHEEIVGDVRYVLQKSIEKFEKGEEEAVSERWYAALSEGATKAKVIVEM
ncbi:hypothetical protein EG328_007743 [Venturia inaequalis]|uniref:Uncharacterized protein n=1 Tax=Venturia inaequalis TaxID=5025 RepID=A0A8H3VDQ3_VENIN|nr:hypothetical protein EG328_007743 [Venturia inaequalis]